jgi:cytochrome c
MMPNKLRLLFFALLAAFSCRTEEEKFVTEKPDENRFTKITLIEKLDEPMELEVLEDGRVIFIERKGKVRMYEPATGIAKDIGFLPVYFEAEDGLLGLAKDPGFKNNHWIYLYYSPVGEKSINRLSRFTLVEDIMDMASEKVMLEIPHFRGCCHSGGSLEFDAKGNLFLSLGDDSTPFESDNYNPIDERPGRPENVDAQRSSANSNDLRGSILRITPQPDGSYTIPKGNLFPVGTPNTRPEIYVMGNRNPFRISIDQKTGTLYWGEVGPDAQEDSLRRGPRGHDEINQAKGPGFFGWPYFVGNNKPYWHYNFETKESEYEYDPKAPINNSPNNTGINMLPPAQAAFIWYPYADSEEFPMLGSGGRNAMAGPVYYHDMFPKTEVKFPKYYDGKLFVYDWMRNWIFTVTLDENQDLDTLERFMPSTVFDKPVDMQFGPDGSLYILEYGTYWSAQNDDSGIYKIEFSAGNRKPIAKATADKAQGAAPLSVSFDAGKSFDFDEGDSFVYQWDFEGNGKNVSTGQEASHTYSQPGVYKAKLTVKDNEGLEASAELEIAVGNEPPQIDIQWTGNKSFYFGKGPIDYQVTLIDKEDGAGNNGVLEATSARLTWDYLPEGFDKVESGLGHQQPALSAFSVGEGLIVKSGCNACHGVDNVSIGPSYTQVALKYEDREDAKDYLMQKITAGGGGVWGERQMPSHSHIAQADIGHMVDYVLSLSPKNQSNLSNGIPPSGALKLDRHDGPNGKGVYLFTASYQDKGANGIKPILRQEQIMLRDPLILAADADEFVGTAKANFRDSRLVKFTENKSYLVFRDIDLTGLTELVLALDPNRKNGWFELRLGGVDGKTLAKSQVISNDSRPKNSQEKWFDVTIKMEPSSDRGDLYLVFQTETGVDIWGSFLLHTVRFKN